MAAPEPTGAPPRGFHAAAALLLLAAVLAAFRPALEAELVNWDDDSLLLRNPAWRAPGAVAWGFRTSTMGHFQPLTWLSYRLDAALHGAPESLSDPRAGGFHLTNVLLHGLMAVAFYALALQLFARAPGLAAARRAGRRWLAPVTALLAALFWAVHPLRAESVAWVTERRDVLSGLLLVLAVWAWVRGAPQRDAPDARRAGWAALLALLAAGLALWSLDRGGPQLALRGPGAAGLALALAAWLASAVLAARSARRGCAAAWATAAALLAFASLLAKAWGIVLPAVLLVLDAWPLRRLERRGVAGALLEKAPFLCLSAVFGVLAAWAQGQQAGTVAALEQHTAGERVVQGLYGLAWYARHTVLPLGLSPYHPLPPQLALTEPRFLLAALAVLGAGLLAWWVRRRAPAVPAAGIAYLAIVSPVLGVLQSGPQLVAERYGYLATIPLVLLLAAGAALLALRRPRWTPALVAAGALWILVLGAQARREARVWSSSASLWTRAVARAPQDPFVAAKLAQVRLDEARAECDPARKLALAREAREALGERVAAGDPAWLSTSSQAHQLLAELEPQRRGEHLALAVERAEAALAAAGGPEAAPPDHLLNLGVALLAGGRAADATSVLARCVERRPDEPLARASLGAALAAQGRFGEARAQLEAAVGLDPGHAKAWSHLASVLDQLGDAPAAARAWRRLLELWPNYAPARQRLQQLERGG